MYRSLIVVSLSVLVAYLLATLPSEPITYENAYEPYAAATRASSSTSTQNQRTINRQDRTTNSLNSQVSLPPTVISSSTKNTQEHFSTTTAPQANPTPRMRFGIHSPTVTDFNTTQQKLGVEVDFVAAHIHWGNENAFPSHVAKELTSNQTLFIFWNPMDYTKGAYDQEEFHYKHILAGDWDDYIESFVEETRKYGYPVVLIPLEEVNGYWTHWSGSEGRYGTPEDYKKVYHYLHNAFEEVPNVSFGWVINNVSVPNTTENEIAAYYPGTAYVDVIGINGFNFGDPWLTFDEIFANAYKEVQRYQKPIYITSLASAEGSKKAAWIEEFFTHPLLTENKIKGWIWFNEDKERDWRMWSDQKSFEVFTENLSE